MSNCCPNCGVDSLGVEAISICTDCATATVAGASFSVPTVLVCAFAATVLTVAARLFVRRSRRPRLRLAAA